MRTRPRLIEIERHAGGDQPLRAEIDPTRMTQEVAGAVGLLLDETRPPVDAGAPAPDRTTYDVVLD